MQLVDLVGWLASAVFIATLIRQIYKQWRSDAAQGVSRWLFIGQISASVLFILYSYLVGNAVFIVSNVLILLTALTGHVLHRIKQRRMELRRAVSASPAASFGAFLRQLARLGGSD